MASGAYTISFQITALHFAARYGRVDIVKELLHRGADGNVYSDEMMTPLHMTAKDCKVEATVSTSLEEKRERYKDSTRSLPEGTKDPDSDEVPAKKIIFLLIKDGVLVYPNG